MKNELFGNSEQLELDTISRADAIALAEELENKRLKGEIDLIYAPMIKGIKALPSAQPNLQPTCNQLATDCISRAGAIETVRKAKSIGQAHRMLVQLPSAQQWIPSYAGENVPEVGDAVLVTFKNSDGEADVYIARWGGNFYDCGYYCLSVSEVLAFMPLPTPYREGEQNG